MNHLSLIELNHAWLGAPACLNRIPLLRRYCGYRIKKSKQVRFSQPHGTAIALTGAWNFYVPSLELKLPYVVGGHIHCIHASAMNREEAFAAPPTLAYGKYVAGEWANAYRKSARRRAIENYIAASRLHAAGLGPKPLGLCYVRKFHSPFDPEPCENSGIMVENIGKLTPKSPATRDQILRASVTIDKIESCLRQQIRGYVSDLNSVCGVMPVDAEVEIRQMLDWFEDKCGTPEPLLKTEHHPYITAKTII